MSKRLIIFLALVITTTVCLAAQADEDDGKVVASQTVKREWPDGSARMILTKYSDGSTKVSQYFENGNLSVEVRHNNKLQQHGLFRQWHKNGQLAKEGYWENGAREGTFTSWLADGQPVARTEYEKGEIVEEYRWSRLTRSWFVPKRR
jgi:antitoxin component YwqK of YwqJK toxin-antitoxin module